MSHLCHVNDPEEESKLVNGLQIILTEYNISEVCSNVTQCVLDTMSTQCGIEAKEIQYQNLIVAGVIASICLCCICYFALKRSSGRCVSCLFSSVGLQIQDPEDLDIAYHKFP